MTNIGDKLDSHLYDNGITICTASNMKVSNNIYCAIEDVVFDMQFELYDIIEIYLSNYEES